VKAELVIFDVAGTTVLDGDLVIDAMADALAADHVVVDREAIRSRMGLPKRAVIRELVTRFSARAPVQLDARTERIHQWFLETLERSYRVHPGVREVPGARAVFQSLHDKSIKVALDTGFNRSTLNVLLDRLGWTGSGLIDCSAASDEVSQGRPAPYLIRRVMQLAVVTDPARVVKVGDTPADIESGRSAGCGAVIGVSYGTHTREELERYRPTRVIGALEELLHAIEELTGP
jgi:phosphonatase-like hydrolase